jgi:repressor LexA
MMTYLTKKQKGIFDFLKEYITDKGYAPSIQELCDHFGTTSLSTMHKQLVTLENKGFIKRSPNMKRAIELAREDEKGDQDRLETPCMGMLSEGNPVGTTGMIEYMKMPDKLVKGKRVFMLKVSGNAYESENIENRDYLIIESTTTYKNFNLVLLTLDPHNTTIRRITKERGKVTLALANPNVKPVVLDESEVKILGVVIGVFRCLVEV